MVRDLNKYDIMAHEAEQAGNYLDWFERVYSGAITGELKVPWGYKIANPFLIAWLNEKNHNNCPEKTALKIGCGLGDDAEELARRGFQTTAFDISPSAIALAEDRFSGSRVNYQVADLFNPPPGWKNAFDVVVEIFTIQALTLGMRQEACARVASFLKPGGSLFVVSFGRTKLDDQGNIRPTPKPLRMPWPVTREELDVFTDAGLTEVSFREVADPENAKVRRFIVEYTKQ